MSIIRRRTVLIECIILYVVVVQYRHRTTTYYKIYISIYRILFIIQFLPDVSAFLN
jgi:hypothetical protein